MCPRGDQEVWTTSQLLGVHITANAVNPIFSEAVDESIHKSVTLSESESGLSPLLRPLCPTRWTVRHSAIDSILKNYHNLMSSLNIIQQGHDEYAAKGKGLLMQMESFDTFFSLKLAYLIFSAAEQFSVNLQAKDTTISEGIKGANLLKRHYTLMCTDESFSTFY